ncbi:unnamed protein product [Periconia digitata]|uniref:Uncharacterized protein n=1 Tax=Periconia digitata TaxID=1303443 RepID=A0A9W4UL31_9PLEO|nr:unnamed protein product [Periconia digitata]
MQFFTATVSLLATAGVALASPLEVRTNTCFDGRAPICLGATNPSIGTVNKAQAITTIQQACAKQPTCVPGTTYNPVTGKMPGYTATLIMGNQCGGVTSWSQEACLALFLDNVDAKCGGSSSDTLFHTGYLRSVCDNTFVSFNLGG